VIHPRNRVGFPGTTLNILLRRKEKIGRKFTVRAATAGPSHRTRRTVVITIKAYETKSRRKGGKKWEGKRERGKNKNG